MKIQHEEPGVCVFESALFKTTSTVLETPDLVLVVDPNWLPDEVLGIRNHVERIRNGRPVWLLFTHSDYDHIIGHGAFPGAKIIASDAFATQTDQLAAIAQVKKWDEEYYIERNYPIVYPRVDVAAKQHGQVLAVGATQFTFFLAPGHNSDGMFTLVTTGGRCIWIAGDYLSDVEFPFIYHSSDDYEQTLALTAAILEQYRPDLLIPGHGQVTDSQEEMMRRKEDSLSYIHTLRRCLRENIPFPEEHLWERYRFRKGQETFHRNNVELVRKELINQGEIVP